MPASGTALVVVIRGTCLVIYPISLDLFQYNIERAIGSVNSVRRVIVVALAAWVVVAAIPEV
jgi:hypothetical protein